MIFCSLPHRYSAPVMQSTSQIHLHTSGANDDSAPILFLLSKDPDLFVVISFTCNLTVSLTWDRLWDLLTPLISPVVIPAVRAKMGVIIWNYKKHIKEDQTQMSKVTRFKDSQIFDLLLHHLESNLDFQLNLVRYDERKKDLRV